MSNRPFPSPRRTLVDTSGYYALLDTTEARHRAAQSTLAGLTKERWRIVTTNLIIAETHALLLIRSGYRTALRFLDRLEQSSTVVVRVTEQDEQRAREIIRQYDDKNFSLTDAASFAVMERLGIGHAFTFDRNFSQYGFTLLTPDQFGER